jgi:hypothetical protein
MDRACLFPMLVMSYSYVCTFSVPINCVTSEELNLFHHIFWREFRLYMHVYMESIIGNLIHCHLLISKLALDSSLYSYQYHKYSTCHSTVCNIAQQIILFNVYGTRYRSQGSSVSIVSDYGLDDPAIGVRSPAEENYSFPLTSVSRPVLRPTQPPVQWVWGGPFPGAKRGRRVTSHPHLMLR